MAVNPINPPLPADLPENWQYGQTVAPNGADVGLAEQYGYNYLMQQVNAAQEGVNALGQAVEGLGGEVENLGNEIENLPTNNIMLSADGKIVESNGTDVTEQFREALQMSAVDVSIPNATAELLDLPDGATVNDGFLKLALGVGKYGYTVHFQWPDGSPMVGYPVSGLTAIDGSALTTDDTGTVFGISSATRVSVQLSQNEYFDIDTVGGTLNSTGMLTEGTFKAKVRTGTFPYIDSSRTCVFSQWAPPVDICAVGGGGSGGAAYPYTGNGPVITIAACGGAGGYVNVLRNYNPAGKTLTVTIGAGGSSVSASSSNPDRSGNAGGTTSVTVGGSTLVSANGGNGGDAGYDGVAYNQGAGAYGYSTNGGSGAGGCVATANLSDGTIARVGASGENGADGEGAGTHPGKGQGTTTTFAGIMYSSAGGGAAYATNANGTVVRDEKPGGSGAGAGKVNGNGGNGTTKGAGGGGSAASSSGGGTSGAGAGGRVIIKTA